MTVYGTLGELSDAQLQTALDRFDLGRLVRTEAFTQGLFGKNVLLVIWEFAVRQTPPWVPDGTFEAWATSFIAPVDLALDTAR